eukprot:CAMPEP_0178375042 /NCGR_PEP_ID=MMETSP0689_2-20121128/2685_1 /TAXON_ID=160604 /ORGANISM="Amphidinium massartii, Strain CS-259" /LENGTH=301 /DNA_ID=CAMNT_0019995025 /DNA_START=130 /DNA_END=1035 /DNA_ORIENTATION=+
MSEALLARMRLQDLTLELDTQSGPASRLEILRALGALNAANANPSASGMDCGLPFYDLDPRAHGAADYISSQTDGLLPSGCPPGLGSEARIPATRLAPNIKPPSIASWAPAPKETNAPWQSPLLPPQRKQNGTGQQKAFTAASPPVAQAASTTGATRVKKKGRLHASEVLAKGITTVMMHQIAPGVSQKNLLQALDSDGFRGGYTYVYLPAQNDLNKSQAQRGYAFIDLVNPEIAATLVSKWAGRKFAVDAADESAKGVFFSIAAVQGFEANLEQIKKTSGSRARRSNHMPFVASAVQLSL